MRIERTIPQVVQSVGAEGELAQVPWQYLGAGAGMDSSAPRSLAMSRAWSWVTRVPPQGAAVDVVPCA